MNSFTVFLSEFHGMLWNKVFNVAITKGMTEIEAKIAANKVCSAAAIAYPEEFGLA